MNRRPRLSLLAVCSARRHEPRLASAGRSSCWSSSGEVPSPYWPPDRPLEWFTIALVLVLFAVLFVACVTIGWWYPPPRRGKAPPGR